MENKSTKCNDVLSQPITRNDQECNDVNADSLTTNVAAAASLDTDLEQQGMYLPVSQQTQAKLKNIDYSWYIPDLCTLGDTLIYAKQLQDGQVPKDLLTFAARKVDDSDSDNDVEKVMDDETKKVKKADTDIDSKKHSNQAEQCASVSTPTTDTTQHQQLQDAATMPALTVSSRPPRPLVLPATAADSVRRHYVSSNLRATASRPMANSVVSSLSRQQSNVVNNASIAKPEEDLVVAVPVEEDDVHVYAVSHDMSQHEQYKQAQIVQVRRINCRLYFVVFLLVTAAVMVTSIVVIKQNKNNGQEQGAQTETETEMTWQENMTQLIVSIMGADAVLLSDVLSPYTKALTWLLQSNDKNTSQEMTSTMAQRFYAASFYYDTTTDDDKWTNCNPPTNSSSELDQTCIIFSINDYTSATYTTGQAWLSDSHECEWYGVTCDYHLQITGLELSNMSLVGTIPSSTVKFPFLQVLTLPGSRLEGNVLLLSDCPHLTEVNLNNNLLSGNLSSVWQHRKLKEVWAKDNYLTGSLSSQIGNLADLHYFSLSNNELTGTVPSEIGWFDSIYSFEINRNHFQGKLLPFLQLWSKIRFFDISDNSLSGSIPIFLGELNKTLLYLNLYDNKFTGILPDELFHLTELYSLDVSNNDLSGTLDARIAQWNTSIIELGLSGNHFKGTIPTELGLLTDLFEIYLQGNDFTGSVPASLCEISRKDNRIFADCAKDDNGQAELQCDCCTHCCQADGTHCQPK